MKNHFFFSYAGNKRNEVKKIIENVDMTDTRTIIEPYCGTSALSFYLSSIYPKKFKYILNDVDNLLTKLYTIAQDEQKLQELQDKINIMIQGIDKEKYNTISKQNTLESYFITHKIHYLRPGLFPNGNRKIPNNINLIDVPIVKFLRDENVEITNIDGVSCYQKYCNDQNSLIFIDPPYLDACNDFYIDHRKTNIYEYLYNNPISGVKATVILCLENNWIIKLLFAGYKHHTYDKKYGFSRKKTSHIVITNKNDD